MFYGERHTRGPRPSACSRCVGRRLHSSALVATRSTMTAPWRSKPPWAHSRVVASSPAAAAPPRPSSRPLYAAVKAPTGVADSHFCGTHHEVTPATRQNRRCDQPGRFCRRIGPHLQGGSGCEFYRRRTQVSDGDTFHHPRRRGPRSVGWSNGEREPPLHGLRAER